MGNPTNNLFNEICSYENLELAFQKARKHKTLKPYVVEFEKNLEENLSRLRNELIFHTYKSKPLKTFILRDPKTRKISKSHFRDRVIHHALCNIIEPIFDKSFIYDSYANRKGKGSLKAIQRFDYFKRKVSKNNTGTCFILKADIKHYFETVNHAILLGTIKKKIKDKKVIWLIKTIVASCSRERERERERANAKGMPLGNLTSQFFANIYLNELDQFVKHKLRAKYYARYVDDFVILHNSKKILEQYQVKINQFLNNKLKLELHPDKSKIIKLYGGLGFLGFRIFFYHKLIRKKNFRKFENKFRELKTLYWDGIISREKAMEYFEGWLAYISHANTYKYRRYLTRLFNQCFPPKPAIKINNPKKHENFIKKVNLGNLQFSSQKTLQSFKKGLTIKEIAEKRNIKESTVWEHFAKLIEYNQLSVWKVLPKEKIFKISPRIHNENDKLKDIGTRINNNLITFNEINCVLASIKCKNIKKKKRKNSL